MANVPSGGDLAQKRAANDQYSEVDGADLPFNSGINGQYIGSYTPGDLGVDAVNRIGSCDSTGSDPMFEKFAREHRPGADVNIETKSESPENVGSEGLAGTDSDPMFETSRSDADANDTRG